MKISGLSIFSCLLMASMPAISNHAFAKETPTISYVHYSCESNANFFTMNSLDFKAGNGEVPNSEHFFQNSSQKDKPEELIEVTECDVAGIKLNLTREFMNIPNNSGDLCATLDWAVYQLKADHKVISEFISGCSDDIHIFTTQFNLHLCKSDLSKTLCKSLSLQEIENGKFSPIRIGLIGNWL